MAMRARAPIWCVRVQGVEDGGAKSLSSTVCGSKIWRKKGSTTSFWLSSYNKITKLPFN
ncbi:hypothetical protein HanRHA438_Chr05g0244651 [Helianthus annuus]|nr:hypothetical protein HanRHA438_Chr05g0244651 [Helianthus annuus]